MKCSYFPLVFFVTTLYSLPSNEEIGQYNATVCLFNVFLVVFDTIA